MGKNRKKKFADFSIHDESKSIDYKNIDILRKFLSPEGKILPSRRTGLTSKNHRRLTKAIKRARFICLLPYVSYNS